MLADPQLANDAAAVLQGGAPSERLLEALRDIGAPTASLPRAVAAVAPAAAEMTAEERENAAFKAEVEAMVRNSPPAATSTSNLAHAPVDPSTPVKAFLEGLELPQYIPAFLEDEVDLPTLSLVQRRQGSAALHDALTELGVKTKGHRLRIAAGLA